MFLHLSVSHSLHRGCLPQCMLGHTHTPSLARHPPGQTTPQTDNPLHSACWDTPTVQCMLGYTPLHSACWDRHGYYCGRYASYWNAFLFWFNFMNNMPNIQYVCYVLGYLSFVSSMFHFCTRLSKMFRVSFWWTKNVTICKEMVYIALETDSLVKSFQLTFKHKTLNDTCIYLRYIII